MRRALCLTICIFALACKPPGPGDHCNANKGSSACDVGLVCEADSTGNDICQVPPGGQCDLQADDPFCAQGTSCVQVTQTVDGQQVTSGSCFLTQGDTCSPDAGADQAQCSADLQCAPFADSTYACELPVAIRGQVLDSTDQSGIAGAQIIALDETPTAVTDVSISAADGSYELRLPVVRNADGTPILGPAYTLRASADGYITFPGGLRQAIPVSTTLAEQTDQGWFISGTLTDLLLLPVQDPQAPRFHISGHVVVTDNPAQQAGVLVVANPSSNGPGLAALSDRSGAYTIFNVPPDDYEVRGYAAGLQLTPGQVTIADQDSDGVDLTVSDNPLSTISGTMQIVDPGDCAMTSVVLAVESTFDETVGRGEFPPGLRAPAVGTAPNIVNGATWTISDIPDGRYVVLAGFENDNCVRDPDTGIGGTATVHIALPTDAGTLTQTFKVTGALGVVGPGADGPEELTDPPTLTWDDDASESDYLIEVFDAYGNKVWTATHDQVNGSSTVSEPYTGPFDSGMYYQFRATSRDVAGTPLSRTEDLRGVFFVP